MHYDALTIDAQTVFESGFRFESGLLAQLRQFETGPTKFVISRVVAREILKHLTLRTEEVHQSLQGNLKKAIEHQLPIAAPDLSVIDPKLVARTRLTTFIQATGGEMIDYDKVNLPEILDRYFKPAPPFATGKKKSEFPDAVALLSLEEWGKANGKRILAVSNDADWASFAEGSAIIDVKSGLADALADLQKNIAEATEIVVELFERIKTDDGSGLREDFRSSLDGEVSGYVAYGEADSYHEVEGDEIDLTLIDFDLDEDLADLAFEIVQAQPTYLVVQIKLKVKVEAKGSFSFRAYDSIDKDYVSLGSSIATTEQELELTALATFERDGGEAEQPWSVSNVELLGSGEVIDFGYIEPDYSREWEDEG